ncbi:glutamyl/glutaminyl-tRNA synthetase [Kipferlia bialata]|uniref:Glutamyl/glutaminyl-tRNA synthetase n=1 Tax=Kipferlia bialata TaxID=797122 RepID=A0A9K3D131_9EUKA|nr:glutamyl/glutaminyl-tRNA synthetase [Kipferlia bialata]|eukprot:g9069.t1
MAKKGKNKYLKACEVLSIPHEPEAVPEAVQNLVINISRSIPANPAHTEYILRRVFAGEVPTQPQLTAGLAHMATLGDAPVDDAAFDVSCGIGVEYTEEEIKEAMVAAVDAALPRLIQLGKPIVGLALKPLKERLPWLNIKAHTSALSKMVEEALANAPTPEVEEVPATPLPTDKVSPPAPSAPEEVTDEMVFGAIPAENRYTSMQTPENAAAHKAFLESVGATILTRFPPEPNGYLHLGHAKSCFLNFGYAAQRGGKTYLRFDDTNPEKESHEYINSIKKDVAWLGHTPFTVTHTSDYFQQLYDIACDLVSRGLAYVDDQNKEDMSSYR